MLVECLRFPEPLPEVSFPLLFPTPPSDLRFFGVVMSCLGRSVVIGPARVCVYLFTYCWLRSVWQLYPLPSCLISGACWVCAACS